MQSIAEDDACTRESYAGLFESRATLSGTTASDSPGGPMVLVVEDDPDIRAPVVLLLENEGYTVVAAPHGQAALSLLREGIVPRAILLDLGMPVMSGWEFRSHQLADPALAAIPTIVVSADPGASRLAASRGVRDVLTKPVDVDVLLRSLARICVS